MGRTSALASAGGIHFKEPWLLQPMHYPVASLEAYDSGAVTRDSSTVAFFTEMARRGAQDTTNWTADTYKTILSVSSGKGLVAAYIGCTAGGAETHTVEITVDGVVSTLAVVCAASERAVLAAGLQNSSLYTVDGEMSQARSEALDANKVTFSEGPSSVVHVPAWWSTTMLGIPLLRFNNSLLIRAKHSVSITNATATAYSAVMYRLGQ